MKFNENKKLLIGSGVITRGRTDRQTGFTKPTAPIFAVFSCPSTSSKTSQIVLSSLISFQEGMVYSDAQRQNGHTIAQQRYGRNVSSICVPNVLCLC